MRAVVLLTTALLSFSLAAQPVEEDRASRRDAAQKKKDEAPKIKQATQNAALTGKVKSALAAEVGLKTLKVNVDSADGVVTLNGSVDSADTAKRATAVARKVKGVKSVQNQLTVGG